MKNTTKIALALIAMLFAFAAKAQTTCATAASYTYPINQTVSSYTNSIYWFKVTLDTGTYQIQITNAAGTGTVVATDVYTSNTGCGDTNFVETDSVIAATNSFRIQVYDSLSTTYYLRLHTGGTNTTFSVQTVSSCAIVGQIGYCPGQTITLGAFPIAGTGTTIATSYTWSANAGSATTPTVALTPTITTTYSVTCTIGGSPYTATVSVFPLSTDACNGCQMVKNGTFEICQYLHRRPNNLILPFTNCATYSPTTTPKSDPTSWLSATCATPDYFNSNENPPTGNGLSVSVPTNGHTSSTAAHSGNGYAGFISYFTQTGPNDREYITETLNCTLVTGQMYNVSFYASRANLAGNLACNNIGAYLSAGSINAGGYNVLNYTPQVNSTAVINNAGSWQQVSGTMIGAGETHITLGNFYDDAHTIPYPAAGECYYFVDDISVLPVTPTITASSCVSGTITLTAVGAPTSSLTSWNNGVTTYTGNPISVPSPTVATTYTCVVNLSASCGTCTNPTVTIVVQPATACSGLTPAYTPTVTTTLSGAGPYYASSNIQVNSGITYNIRSTELRMAAGTSITVANNATLVVRGSWIHACDPCSPLSMWQGIIVQNGGTLLIVDDHGAVYNIIEDAVQAVYTASNTAATPIPNWSIENVIFNNNATDIYIDTHPGNLSGNLINNNCIFTCRNLSSHSTAVANFTAIRNDILASTPVLHLSTQNPIDHTIAGLRTKYGIYINAVSSYTNPIAVGGNAGSFTSNIFDNLDYGIYAKQSSLTAKNNIFQNLTGNVTNQTGVGIASDASTGASTGVNAVLIAGNSSTVTTSGESNTFRDCLAGVSTLNMRQMYINNNTFNNETTATNYTTSSTYVTGGYGVVHQGYAASSSTVTPENLQFCNNNVQNCANGYFMSFKKLYNTNSGGSSYLYNNVITSLGAGGQYCATGIYLQQGTATAANAGVPQDAVSVSTNSITNVTTNCIYANNINTGTSNGFVTIAGNTELSVQYNPTASSAASPPTAAIYASNCVKIKISNNPLIKCTGLTGSYLSSYAQYIAGIYVANSNFSRVTCNAVSNVGEDFVWYDYNFRSSWWENGMSTSRYGLTLRNNGFMDGQGSTGSPSYNVWGHTDLSSAQTLCDATDPGSATPSIITSKASTCSGSTTFLPCVNSNIGVGSAAYGASTLSVTTGASPALCYSEGGTGRMAANSQPVTGNNIQGNNAQSDSSLSAMLNFSDSLPVYTWQTHWGI